MRLLKCGGHIDETNVRTLCHAPAATYSKPPLHREVRMPAASQENRLALYSLSYSISIYLGATTCIDVLGHMKRGKDLRSMRSTAVERGCSQNFMVKKKRKRRC